MKHAQMTAALDEWESLSFPRAPDPQSSPLVKTAGMHDAKARAVLTNPAVRAVDDLKSEIKLLHWHKLANDAALKAAIMKTTSANAARPVPRPADTMAERAQRMQQVIEEEQAKPLEVSRLYKMRCEREQSIAQERLNIEIQTHIECLHKLKADMLARESIRARSVKYKEDKRQLVIRQQARIGSRGSRGVGSQHGGSSRATAGHAEIARGNRCRGGTSSSGLSGRVQQAAAAEAAKVAATKERGNALASVVDSLNRLIDLERRITDLERNNIYDRALAEGRPNVHIGSRAQSGGVVSFQKKKRESMLRKPAANYYAACLTNKRPRVASNTSSVTKRLSRVASTDLEGASSTARDFNSIRAGVERRKDEFHRQLHARVSGTKAARPLVRQALRRNG